LGRTEFSNRAALLLAEVNKLRPFREGNGIAQRMFLESLAGAAGHCLYFDVVSRERMIQASIEAYSGRLVGRDSDAFIMRSDEDRGSCPGAQRIGPFCER
jgi:fido (protein-threonine AMPylation protein)